VSNVRVGPAGWVYRDWSGIVYPKHPPTGFDPLGYIAQYFDTLEINSTFYRPHPPSVARKWLKRVAHNPRFRFTAKLLRRFTHERESAWTRDEVKEARAGLETLQEHDRLGAVLMQFPWSFKKGETELEWLRDLFSAFEGLPLVLEVRHASWNDADFYSELEDAGVGFVNADQPMYKNTMPPGSHATARVGYIRVHGRNYGDWFRKGAGRDARYDYLYSSDELEPWVERATEVASDKLTREVYVVTNNHFRGQSVVNGIQFKSMLKHQPVEAPETLVKAFPEALREYVVPGEAETHASGP
jgi:uncharacterized protein YecE (DUF72 family)